MYYTFLVIALVLISNIVHGESWVRLNVGGQRFKLSKDTLTKHQGSFNRFLNGQVRAHPDSKGNYYIELDRDPEGFRLVAQFLRTGEVFCNDIALLKLAKNEADFYELQEMAALISEKLSKLEIKPTKWAKTAGVFSGNLTELRSWLNRHEKNLLHVSTLNVVTIAGSKPRYFVMYLREYPIKN